VLLHHPAYPEVRALQGALAKRRVSLHTTADQRGRDIRLSMESYRYEYERDLNAYYQGINVVALGVVLSLQYEDEAAGRLARELLPAVRVAAGLAAKKDTGDYWSTVTLAECTLYESLLGLDGTSVADAYRTAGALRPPRGDLDSTLSQLEFLRLFAVPEGPLAEAEAGLLGGAGAFA
jgi:hypothetical protein